MAETLNSATVSTQQPRIAEWASQSPRMAFTYPEEGSPQGGVIYYGVTGNFYALTAFQSRVQRIWRKWLGRRKCDGQIQWDHFNRLLRRYPLPAAVVIHSVYRRGAKPYPEEPDARIGHVRICGSPGGAIPRGDPAIANFGKSHFTPPHPGGQVKPSDTCPCFAYGSDSAGRAGCVLFDSSVPPGCLYGGVDLPSPSALTLSAFSANRLYLTSSISDPPSTTATVATADSPAPAR